jgi:phosphate transport system substrate-binding protein
MSVRNGLTVVMLAVIPLMAGCGDSPSGSGSGNAPADTQLSGDIKVDGSSTVYPITESVAANFRKNHPDVNITVGISGTGGGFKKFAAGETDISDASRPIKESEAEACAKNGIEFVEFQVAWDGLTVVINKENDWAKTMTVEQLRKIWHPDTAVTKWSEVDPSWPDEEIKLYGAGSDSGTFDYFTEAINGKEKLSRKNYIASEDDNTTVNGVAGNKYGLGYFGLAYYIENKDKLSAVSISPEKGQPPVAPSIETVLDKTYRPLSRPLFIYVKKSSLKRPEIRAFLEYYLRRDDLIDQAGYIRLTAEEQFTNQEKLKTAIKEAE